MTNKIKTLLVAALVALSPFAPTAQAAGGRVLVKVISFPSIEIASLTNVNFGRIAHGYVPSVSSIRLDCSDNSVSITRRGEDEVPLSSIENHACGEVTVQAGGTGNRDAAYSISISRTEPTLQSENVTRNLGHSLSAYRYDNNDTADRETPIITSLSSNGLRNGGSYTISPGETHVYYIGGLLSLGSADPAGIYQGTYTFVVNVE